MDGLLVLAMQRREALAFIGLGSGIGVAALLIGCDADAGPSSPPGEEPDAGGGNPATPDAANPTTSPDACVAPTVLMHDTNAQALYLDGSFGPLTGNIKV